MPNMGICYFIGGWGWLDICCVLSGTNVRIFSFERRKREENVLKTMFLFGKYGYFCGEKGEKTCRTAKWHNSN